MSGGGFCPKNKPAGAAAMAASRGWVGQPIIWLVLNAIEDLNYDLAVGPWHSLKTNQFSGTLGLLPCRPPEDGLANPSSG